MRWEARERTTSCGVRPRGLGGGDILMILDLAAAGLGLRRSGWVMGLGVLGGFDEDGCCFEPELDIIIMLIRTADCPTLNAQRSTQRFPV